MRGALPGEGTATPRAADVARLAGVSQKTVSRVINAEPYVSVAVRRRVVEAAGALGYRRNSAARALASGRTGSIGMVTTGATSYGAASLFMGIERAVRDTGYALCVVNALPGDPTSIDGALDSLLEHGVDGIIISEPFDGETDSLARLEVPALVVGAPPFTEPGVLAVGLDTGLMARTAAEYLLDLGHSTVHHLSGPQGSHTARNLLKGWRTALATRGRNEPPIAEGDWSAASGYAAGRELAADPQVTAVFSANDEMAIGLMCALTEAGRHVPDGVSVVGFDDIPIAAYTAPPLTTMRQPFDAVGREGIQRLVHCIENPQAAALPRAVPPVDLVVRASTGPPPSQAMPRRGPADQVLYLRTDRAWQSADVLCTGARRQPQRDPAPVP